MKKRKVIIDCDPGIDDSLAIMLALKSPDVSSSSSPHDTNDRLDISTIINILKILNCFIFFVFNV